MDLNIEKTIERLHEIILDYMGGLVIEGDKQNQKLKVMTAAKKAKTEKNLEGLLSIRDLIQNDAISDKLKVVGYFKQNQATETSQYQIAYKSILESDLVQDSDKEEIILLDEKKKISSAILSCKEAVENGNYDIKFILEVLTAKNISKEEILSIFSTLAFITCAPKTKEIELEEHNFVELEKLKSIIKDNEELVLDIKKIVEEFYFLTEKKTPSQIKVYEYVVDLLRESNRKSNNSDEELFDISDMQNPEEALTVLIFNMVDTNNSIKNIIANDQISEDDILMLELFYEELKEHYELASILIPRVKEIKNEEEPTQSNVIYLHDDKDEIPFSVSDFPGDGKSRVRLLIEGLQKGVCDSEKGLLHSKLNHEFDFTVFINKKQPMACSYIRINDNLVMVLEIETLKNIYASTSSLIKKKEAYIRNLIKNGLVENELQKHLATAEIFEDQILENNKGANSL